MDKTQPEKKISTLKTPEKKVRLKRLFVTVLSVLFILGGVLILHWHRPKTTFPMNPTHSSTTQANRTSVLRTINKTTVTEPKVDATSMLQMTPTTETDIETSASTLTEEPKQTIVVDEEPIEPKITTVEKPALPKSLELHSRLAAGTAKLADLLALRDDFTNNDDCIQGYQKLLTLEPRTSLLQKAADSLMPLCTKKEPVMTSVNQSFLKAKKRAIMAYYKAKYPKWWIIKAIPVSVIEIRRLNPTKNRPIDILYRAQNALIRQDIVQAVRFVNELPPVMRAQMDDFVHEADIYKQARESLDAVILSFEKGE